MIMDRRKQAKTNGRHQSINNSSLSFVKQTTELKEMKLKYFTMKINASYSFFIYMMKSKNATFFFCFILFPLPFFFSSSFFRFQCQFFKLAKIFYHFFANDAVIFSCLFQVKASKFTSVIFMIMVSKLELIN